MIWITDALKKAQISINKTLAQNFQGFPYYSEDNRWCFSPVTGWENSYGDWTAGFWPGILWTAYEINNDMRYLQQAYLFTNMLKDRLAFTGHDLGFLFFPSCVKGYILSKKLEYQAWALQAATQLADRFDPKIKLITINDTNATENVAALDTMMNLPLLWWAYKKTNQEVFFDIAMQHAQSTLEHFLRPDGSTCHIIKFSKLKNEIIWKGTWQGKDNLSCWSRGQAWALCGFLMAKRYSETENFDEAIELLFDYIVKHLPSDMVPYWDYDIIDSDAQWRDTSAAGIMCYGLLHYSETCPDNSDKTDKKKFKDLGLKILHALATDYTVNPEKSGPGLLHHGCFHAPNNFATSACLIFGDYYYLESLLKARSLIT